MKRMFMGTLVSPVLLGLAAASQPPAELVARHEKEATPLLKQYCVSCHSGAQPSGGVSLDPADVAGIHKNADNWRKGLARLKDRSMPPRGSSRPSEPQRQALIADLTAVLDAAPVKATPGHTVLRRLSRLEYNNTVRDLFGVTTKPADSFPADGGGGGGFDNNADTLFLPPVLLERYLVAAQEVIDAAPAERLFPVKPSAKLPARAAAKLLIERQASRAFRRPVQPEETARLLRLYDSKTSYEDGVKAALKAVLISPSFLFRVEEAPVNTGNIALTDYELISRLSYFLWSSMPDDTLFALAREKKLRQPGVLTAQVRRMLLDPKARSFYDSFVSQWLHTRDLMTGIAAPDRGRFPQFDTALRDAMYQEPVLFFESLCRDNAPLTQLLSADYTFVNDKLAAHYGMEPVSGGGFKRVPVDTARRGGILTMAATLTVSSYPQRTSPVLRGKWILSEVLGTPPPPPPPVTKTLPPSDKKEGGLTFKQRLEKHREEPACAGCHARIDPMGFGLENYDPIGRWRDKIADDPVDASAKLLTGEEYHNPAEFKALVVKQQEQFLRNLVEKTLAYALGRGLEPTDQPAVKKILATLKTEGYKSETLFREVVLSLPFQFKEGR
ncbi:DUF1592 domain-containing protein [Armatimonas rosea]|uniref:Mono/diheme cytochrome c family protein n=1 Tax=Armatimonas rosea TaxID=685828 RepID=A0A7W9W772_ARMRO|nr:DUF1592 domain-containing protein [Armatimonas rosea]MBB6050327.1 mono/diheme cytochrome c family protein [Armatimonas rosea]